MRPTDATVHSLDVGVDPDANHCDDKLITDDDVFYGGADGPRAGAGWFTT